MIAETAEWLASRGVPDEALAELGEKRGLLGIGRRIALIPRGRVWRLGVLLIDSEGRASATGALTRAVEPKHSNYQSVSGEQRRDIRRLAFESSAFVEGESVNYDAVELDLADSALSAGAGPIFLDDGIPTVEWSRGQKRMPLERYLRERRELLTPGDGWTV